MSLKNLFLTIILVGLSQPVFATCFDAGNGKVVCSEDNVGAVPADSKKGQDSASDSNLFPALPKELDKTTWESSELYYPSDSPPTPTETKSVPSDSNGSWDVLPEAKETKSAPSDSNGSWDVLPEAKETKSAPSDSNGSWDVLPEERVTCAGAHKTATVSCNGSQISNFVMPQLSQIQEMRSSGDIVGACRAAKNISRLGFTSNIGFSTVCQNAVSDCKKACENDTTLRISDRNEYKKDCDKFTDNWVSALKQGMQQINQFVQAKDCEKMASGTCSGQDAYSNPLCPTQYCSVGNRILVDPNCNSLAKQCSDPATARTNPGCTCISNPSAAGCPSGPPALANNPKTTVDTKALLDSLGNGPTDDDYNGRDPSGKQAQTESQQVGGPSGLSNGGGGGFGGSGSGSGDGSNGSGVNTNILGKPSSGGGGYPFAGGGSGGGGGGYPFNRGGGSAGNSKTLNLRDFLPGGKKDVRQIASQTLAQQGITPSMGLTNFQKVTRKIAEKRTSLEP